MLKKDKFIFNIHPRSLGKINFTMKCGDCDVVPFISESDNLLVIDLSLGAIMPHHAAVEICDQLKLEKINNSDLSQGLRASLTKSITSVIGVLIDAETAGYQPIMTALAYAARVLPRLAVSPQPIHLVVMTPRDGSAMGEENEWFLQALAEQLGARLILTGYGPMVPDLPDHWSVAVEKAPAEDLESPYAAAAVYGAPGLIGAADVAALCPNGPDAYGLIRLAGGAYLVPPLARAIMQDPATVLPIIGRQAVTPWLRGYAVSRCGRQEDVPSLIALGWSAVGEGSYAVALKILNATVDLVDHPIAKAQVTVMTQGLRIGMEDFVTAAAAPVPAETLPKKLRGQLLQHKGWGLVMSGHAHEAQPFFREAVALLETEQPTFEYLYLMNIYALVHLRTGDEEGAYAIEKTIARHLEAMQNPDPHLVYINCMNTARIHLRRREIDAADRLFKRAFDWTLGLRSLTDHLTCQIYQARLAHLRGQRDLVQRHTFRAALFWLAAPMPESVSLRAARLFLNYTVPPRHSWVDGISLALTQKLAEAYGIAPPPVGEDVPTFVMLDPASGVDWTVIGRCDGTFLAAQDETVPCQSAPGYRQLQALVHYLIKDDLAAAGLEAARTIAIDDRLGYDLAETIDEVRETALRASCETVWFNKKRINGVEEQQPVTLVKSDGVCGFDLDGHPHTVSFSRYRQPCAIDADQGRLLRLIADRRHDVGSLCAALAIDQDRLNGTIRQLEKLGIVRQVVGA